MVMSLSWDVAGLDMGVCVMEYKVLLVLHLRYLDQESLAQRVYLEQLTMGWPGLALEVEEICLQLNIENVNTTKKNKYKYKQILSRACQVKNEQILRDMSEGKEKCARIQKEAYGQKEYIEKKNISEVRNIYRTRFGQRDFAGNFSKDNKYRKSDWLCRCLMSKEKEAHITSTQYPIYSDIREKYNNFDNDKELVAYFDAVLERREVIDTLERNERDNYN